jgi:hypothetical protein
VVRWRSRFGDSVSQVDLAAGFMRTDEIKIRPDQRRAAQRGEDTSLPRLGDPALG